MILVGDDAVWLSDTPTMVSMDPKTLNVTGHTVWANDAKSPTGITQPSWVESMHMASGSSAHPLPRPGTGDYIDFLMTSPLLPLAKDYHLDVYTFAANTQGPQS